MQNQIRGFSNRLVMVTLAVGLLTSWSHAQNKHVFVTSETTDGSIAELALTGIPAANAICTRPKISAISKTGPFPGS